MSPWFADRSSLIIKSQILKDSSLFKNRGNDHGWAKDSANSGVASSVNLAKDSQPGYHPVKKFTTAKLTLSGSKGNLIHRMTFRALLAPLSLAGLMSQQLT